MTELKTQKNEASVDGFLQTIEDEKKRADSYKLIELMRAATGDEPSMWGPSIIGFGSYRYEYASGRRGEWFLTGFSPRKRNLTLYIMSGFDSYDSLLADIGKYKTGKSCLYINKLEDVQEDVLRELITRSVEHMQASSVD